MHKKLFTAVLALGLLLLANSVAFAIALPAIPGEVPVLAFGGGQSKGAASDRVLLEPDPAVQLQSGSARSVPGTFCDGRWQGPVTYRIPGWMVGLEFYGVYQDPNQALPYSFNTCGVPSNYTFDVTAINWHVTLRPAGGTVVYPYTTYIQPMTFSVDPAFPACETPSAVPGGVNCSGPIYSVTFTTNGLYLLSLPFPVECCETGPYFAGVYLPSVINGAQMQIITDDGTFNGGPVLGQLCRTWNEWGAGWCDLNDPAGCAWFEVNLSMWSEGYTPDDPVTHCTPGTCTYEYYYDPAAAPAFAFGLAAGANRDRLGERLDAVGLDTLVEVVFAMNGSASITNFADLVLEIYDGDEAVAGCGPAPSYPGTLLYSEVIPEGSWIPGNYTVWPLATPFVWGTLNGGFTQSIVVALGAVPATGSTAGLLANNDDGSCALTDHFIARYNTTPATSWHYIVEVSGISPEPFMEFRICREVLPAIETDCGAGGPDEWSQYAHDAQQTSASSINVVDPNGVKLAWTQPFTSSVPFTNPTVANDIVYISSNNRLSAFSLTSGAPVGIVSGSPEMSSSDNRGNTTVAFVRGLPSGPDRDVVVVSGGTFNAISVWETNLETSGPTPIWGATQGVGSTIPGGLLAKTRFGTAKVVDVAGTDVLFVLTEPSTGPGHLWALNAGSGALYPGWATNPVILDAAGKHGPAVSSGKLYVGTAIGGSNVSGSLYQINAADGVIDWNFVGVAGEGWPSGVSTEGAFLYGASKDAGNIGYRYKIDKSGALPSVVWTSTQGTGLYGTPTIGRAFVYFPLDNPSFGLLQVKKDLGLVSRNFAASDDICGNTVFMVPQIVTLSCDSYIFAGDRNARWWLLNAVTGAYEWYRQFPIPGAGIVNGTALATGTDGFDYAVVGIRLTAAGGSVSAYRLNTGARQRLIQCVEDVTISVALNSGAGQPHSEPGALLSIGNVPVTFSGYAVSDPLPGVAAIGRDTRQSMARLSSVARDFDGYSTIATSSTLTKRHRIAGLSTDMAEGGEFTRIAANRMESMDENLAKARSNSGASAASAATIRTSAVTINASGFPYVLAVGATGDLDWLYDGTGLGRGLDDNVLELTNDDPDFDFDAVNNGGISVAEVYIHYVGGCLTAMDTLHFGAANYELVFNNGALGDDGKDDDWYFATDPVDPETNNYDSGLMLLGDSTAGINGGAQIRSQVYGSTDGHFVPNAAPVSNVCGFDKLTNVLLGTRRTGGCPGTPVDIFGEMITHSMSDTDMAAAPGTRMAAIGVDIIQTEVGAYDPLYGDFKLIQWEVVNRDAVAKGPIYIGSWTDWDVVPSYAVNIGNFSAAANGYYIYDGSLPANAYGQLDPSHRSTYSGIQPMNPAKRIVIHDGPTRRPPWPNDDLQAVWSQTVNETPAYLNDVLGGEDKQGLLINAAMNFGPNESVNRYQAYFGVDASSGVDAVIAANVQALAKRAARWGGWARGDVNDDGFVDLADVAWIQGGNPLYPGAYSGDVDADGDNDAADIARLLSFVSGNAGDAPDGAWRF